MTVSPDARTPSATVHALSGSTPPGAAAVIQPFGVATVVAANVADTFIPLGGAALDVVAGLDQALDRLSGLDPERELTPYEKWKQANAAREA